MFRNLKANEIECRIQSITEKNGKVWAIMLLYKDARCDMNILDETVGNFNWERKHEIIDGRLYCTVSLNNDGQWVSKQDVGTESMTEKEKGQASDSFKRACFNWGIGRELYTAPQIFVQLQQGEFFKDNSGKIKSYAKYVVKDIQYTSNRINYISIVDKNDNVRFQWGKKNEVVN